MSKKPHTVLTPGEASRKRKDRETNFDTFKASKPTSKEAEPTVKDNRLLAGYMAHEFLTQGTLLGQKWDPVRAEAIPVSQYKPPSMKMKRAAVETKPVTAPVVRHQTYADVANLLKVDGVHIEGIVNPTQLAKWLQMG